MIKQLLLICARNRSQYNWFIQENQIPRNMARYIYGEDACRGIRGNLVILLQGYNLNLEYRPEYIMMLLMNNTEIAGVKGT